LRIKLKPNLKNMNVGKELDALSLNTVQRQAVMKRALKLSVPSKDEIFLTG
jgi:hypothetical protein